MVIFENPQTRKLTHGTHWQLSTGHSDTCGTLWNGHRRELYRFSIHVFFDLAILALHIGLFPRGARTIKCLRGCDKKARNSEVHGGKGLKCPKSPAAAPFLHAISKLSMHILAAI